MWIGTSPSPWPIDWQLRGCSGQAVLSAQWHRQLDPWSGPLPVKERWGTAQWELNRSARELAWSPLCERLSQAVLA